MIKQNYKKGYKKSIFAFEASLGLNVGVICIQKPFLGNKNLSHIEFNLYWLSEVYNQIIIKS